MATCWEGLLKLGITTWRYTAGHLSSIPLLISQISLGLFDDVKNFLLWEGEARAPSLHP